MNVKPLVVLLVSGMAAASIGYITPSFADDVSDADAPTVQQDANENAASQDSPTMETENPSDTDGMVPDTAKGGDDDF